MAAIGGEPFAEIVKLQGKAEFKKCKTKKWKIVELGQIFQEEDEIRTKADSDAELYFWKREEILGLKPNSWIRFTKDYYVRKKGIIEKVAKVKPVSNESEEYLGCLIFRGAVADEEEQLILQGASKGEEEKMKEIDSLLVDARFFWEKGLLEKAVAEYKKALEIVDSSEIHEKLKQLYLKLAEQESKRAKELRKKQ